MKFFYRKKKICGLFVICIVIMLSFQIVSATNLNDSINVNTNENPKISAQISGTEYDWLNNSGFDPPVTEWYNITNADVSNPDVNASISSKGIANFEILGKIGGKEIILNETTYTNWADFNKTENALVPNQGYGVGSDGAYCSHDWYDGEFGGGTGADQTPVMYWRTNVSMDVDMSDYEITSASLEAIMNASVDDNIDVESDSNSRFSPDLTLNQRASYDFAQFFVEVADMEVTKLNTFELAFNQTLTLGEESSNNYEIEGNIETKNEQAILDSLTNVLAVDPGHDNFTLILGIYIYCADNYDGYDYDFWDDLRIKSVNLTFTYEKKINQGTYIAWNQDANKISELSPENYTVLATGANLRFKYYIDRNWTKNTSSQNSEINIYLNGNPYPIPIKLIDVNVTDLKQEANIDLINILPVDSVNLSIEVLMRDDFPLEEVITISIDNVTLDISYKIIFDLPLSGGGDGGGGGRTIIQGEDYTPVIIGLIAGIIALVTFFGAYQKHYKYPPMVRKIRKLRKKIRKGKSIKSLLVNTRENLAKASFQKDLRILKEEKVPIKKMAQIDKNSKVSNDKKIKGGAK